MLLTGGKINGDGIGMVSPKSQIAHWPSHRFKKKGFDMKEVWKTIKDYPDYEVSNYGRIRNWWNNQAGAHNKRKKPKMLKETYSRGYCYVGLSNRKKSKRIRLHRLVLTAFKGKCPAGMVTCHNNGIKTDNRLENLRWDTRTANHKDRINHGTSTVNPNNKLFKWRDKQGLTQFQIAKIFGVSPSSIRRYEANKRKIPKKIKTLIINYRAKTSDPKKELSF